MRRPFSTGVIVPVSVAVGDFTAKLTELHDPWWNSIARAME